MISHLELTEALEAGRVTYVEDALNSMARDRAIMMTGALAPWLLPNGLHVIYDCDSKSFKIAELPNGR